MLPSRLRILSSFAVAALVVCSVPSPAAAQTSPLTCDLAGYTRRPDATARMADGVLALEWAGTDGERVSLRLTVRNGAPVVEELALLPAGSATWVSVGSDLGFEFRIVE